jgi:uncharacterized OB-fold protein
VPDAARRPLPNFPEPDTEPFWEATREHELRYQVCDGCSGVVFFPRRHCPHCMGMSLSWKVSKGEGAVYTYTVIRQIGHPAFRPLAPYAVAWIDLDEGFRMLSNVVGVDDPAKDVKIGMRVRVQWEDQEGGLSLPLFAPA